MARSIWPRRAGETRSAGFGGFLPALLPLGLGLRSVHEWGPVQDCGCLEEEGSTGF